MSAEDSSAVTQQPTAIADQQLKEASDFESYTEFCPQCKKNVQTDVDYTAGSCFCMYLVLGLIFCCICIFCLCCDSSKDAHHYCPHCRREFSYKKR